MHRHVRARQHAVQRPRPVDHPDLYGQRDLRQRCRMHRPNVHGQRSDRRLHGILRAGRHEMRRFIARAVVRQRQLRQRYGVPGQQDVYRYPAEWRVLRRVWPRPDALSQFDDATDLWPGGDLRERLHVSLRLRGNHVRRDLRAHDSALQPVRSQPDSAVRRNGRLGGQRGALCDGLCRPRRLQLTSGQARSGPESFSGQRSLSVRPVCTKSTIWRKARYKTGNVFLTWSSDGDPVR